MSPYGLCNNKDIVSEEQLFDALHGMELLVAQAVCDFIVAKKLVYDCVLGVPYGALPLATVTDAIAVVDRQQGATEGLADAKSNFIVF
ncbi:hypothetical protein KIN20_004834 [Parelaphostrongylus tenuis]|uniref:Uncharacterized protein n=1 Tax=Parelaphostrongylus tenuis TaxID=148309 RepID=A0AAD5QEQ7_PARTN|nr:hypothetical protein KIN20_004834 [Parelaphostrongylus tenuis]